jgi:predicted RNA binding protein YcfA (HicA-like mRNA interferase family)
MGFTITEAELIAFLASKGFRKETGRGRHGVKMANGTMRIPITSHRGDMDKGTANKILKQAGYTPDDVLKWRGTK